MSGEVRSSELEIGLSSSDDCKAGDVSKDDLVVTSPSAHSLAKRPASPALSLEVIASTGEEAKKKACLHSPATTGQPVKPLPGEEFRKFSASIAND
nr:hypothetical protein CFP56_44504 [Quercus suber]